jgi:splicing factor 3B subunit 3
LWSVGWPLIRELATVDYLIIGSDSGNLAIVEFHLTPSPRFEVLHKEPYGKSGARRMVPGQWLGVDPRGRSIMLGA